MAGFKPKAGEYWFLFEEDGTKNLFIGSVDESVWVVLVWRDTSPLIKNTFTKNILTSTAHFR